MTPATRLFLSERAASYVDRILRAEKLDLSVRFNRQRRHRLTAAPSSSGPSAVPVIFRSGTLFCRDKNLVFRAILYSCPNCAT